MNAITNAAESLQEYEDALQADAALLVSLKELLKAHKLIPTPKQMGVLMYQLLKLR